MKKTLLATFCITALFVLIILMFPFKENPVIETKTVSIQQEIVLDGERIAEAIQKTRDKMINGEYDKNDLILGI